MPRVLFEITADNSNFIRKTEESKSAIAGTVRAANASGMQLGSLFNSMESGLRRVAAAGAAAFTLSKAKDFVRDCIDVRANIQSLEISFETLLGNKEKADAMVGDIKKFAATTPMDMDSLAKGAQTMLQFNIEQEKVMPMLRAIGDISMGDSQKLESLTLAYSQMASTGKLMGQDLMQMINAGFNPLSEMALKTGKSVGELKKEMEAGNITVKDVTEAFISATSEGGKFHKMLEKQAEGLNGSFAYLRGTVSDAMNEIGGGLESAVVTGVNATADLIKNYKTVGETVGTLVLMYGSYKTAVMVNAALEMSQITRLRKVVLAKNTLTAAITRMNAAMAANPWGLAAAAVVALGVAIYKTATLQTEFEKATKAVNEATDNVNRQFGEEKAKLDELAKRLDKAKKGSEEWKSVKKTIIDQYGRYDSKLSSEIDKVGNLTLSYDKLTKSIRESIAAKGLKDFHEANDKSGERETKYSEWYDKNLKGVFKSEEITRLVNNISADYAKNADSMSDYFMHLENALVTKYGSVKGGEFYKTVYARMKKVDISDLREMNRDSKNERNAERMYMEANNISKEMRDKVLYGIESQPEATSEPVGEELQKQIDTKKKQLKNYEKTSAEAQQKYDDLKRQQAQEVLKTEERYELERWQTRIDLMDEGEAKVLARMQLNKSKELAALKEREQQEIKAEVERQKALFDAGEDVKASKDRKYAKKVFNSDMSDEGNTDIDRSKLDGIRERYKVLYQDMNDIQTKSERERLDAAREAINVYLKEFGSYQQKREAIISEYDKRIAEAQNEGERLTLAAGRDKALSDLDYSEWVDTGDVALAFGDITKLSSETIAELISDMERYRERVIATFDPEKIAEYEEALLRLREVQADDSFGMFASAVPEYFRQRRSLADRLDSAGSSLSELTSQRGMLYDRAGELSEKISQGRANAEDVSGYENELRDVNVQLDKNASATKKAQAAFRKLREQWDEMDSPEAKFYGVCDAIGSVSRLAAQATGDLSGMFAEMGNDDLAKAFGTASEVMGSVNNIAGGFANGGIMGGAMAAFSEVTKWLPKILASDSDPTLAEDTERLTAVNEELIDSIERLADSMEDASLVESEEIYRKQMDNIRQSEANTRELMQRSGAAYGTHHSSNKAIDQNVSDAEWKRISDIVGHSVNSAWDFFSLTSEEMAKVRTEAADIYAHLKDLADDGFKDAAQFMDEYTEYWEQLEEVTDAYKEKITDTSFDSVADSFKSTLLDMEADADDFTVSFEQMMRQAIVNSMMSDKYRKALSDWYDDFSARMEDGKLSDSDLSQLRDSYNGMVKDAMEERDALVAALGLDSQLTASQSATYGGYETMSEDTGQELNGRFAAIQDSNERIAQSVMSCLSLIQSFSSASQEENTILSNILIQHVLTNEYLDDIKTYTRELKSYGAKLDKIASNTSKL